MPMPKLQVFLPCMFLHLNSSSLLAFHGIEVHALCTSLVTLDKFDLFVMPAFGGRRVVEGGIPLEALRTLLITGQCPIE